MLIAFMADVLVYSETIIFLVLKYPSGGFTAVANFENVRDFVKANLVSFSNTKNIKACVKFIPVKQDENNAMHMTLPALGFYLSLHLMINTT